MDDWRGARSVSGSWNCVGGRAVKDCGMCGVVRGLKEKDRANDRKGSHSIRLRLDSHICIPCTNERQ